MPTGLRSSAGVRIEYLLCPLFMSRDCSYQLVFIPYLENCYNLIFFNYISLMLIGQQPVIRRCGLVAGKVTYHGHFHATSQRINIKLNLSSFSLGLQVCCAYGFFCVSKVYLHILCIIFIFK